MNFKKEKEKDLCNERTEVYSRVVGFYRPVIQWNLGKQEEFRDRKDYEINARKKLS
jgi:ribonucleoside-triphosphate reductase